MTEKEFISLQAETLRTRVRIFPDDFSAAAETKDLQLPPTRLNLGDAFFGSIDILNAHNVTVHTTGDVYEAKFIVYASREKRPSLRLPLHAAEIKTAVLAYEKYLDECTRTALTAYQKQFQGGKNGVVCAAEIMRILDLVRF